MADRTPPARPPIILVANNQEWFARSLDSVLGPTGYAVLRARTGRQALELARSTEPDAVILHEQLVDLLGTEVCRRLRADAAFNPATPLLLTANAPFGREQRLAALEAGAWDISIHPLEPEALLLKLRTFLRAKEEHERLRELSYVDQLTGLYNLRGLARRAKEIAAAARRSTAPLACVAFAPEPDLLTVPVSLEQQTVDHIAEKVGELCRRIGRASDAIGRIGPTEFGIVAPGTPADGAVRLAERYRAAIMASPIPIIGSQRTLAVRAGYSTAAEPGDHEVDGEELLSRATLALRGILAERPSNLFVAAWSPEAKTAD